MLKNKKVMHKKPQKYWKKGVLSLFFNKISFKSFWELYFICGKLNIDVDLDELDIKSLNKIIEKKKETLMQFEKSWIWAWANAKSDEERDTLVKKFNKNRK